MNQDREDLDIQGEQRFFSSWVVPRDGFWDEPGGYSRLETTFRTAAHDFHLCSFVVKLLVQDIDEENRSSFS